MRYNWELLAYYIRKPCRLCKLSPELQELIHAAIQQRKTLREIAGALAQRGIRTTQRQVWTHKKHLRKIIEITHAAASDTQRIELEKTKATLAQLKLARTKEEVAQAVLNALKDLTDTPTYNAILKLLEGEAPAEPTQEDNNA